MGKKRTISPFGPASPLNPGIPGSPCTDTEREQRVRREDGGSGQIFCIVLLKNDPAMTYRCPFGPERSSRSLRPGRSTRSRETRSTSDTRSTLKRNAIIKSQNFASDCCSITVTKLSSQVTVGRLMKCVNIAQYHTLLWWTAASCLTSF